MRAVASVPSAESSLRLVQNATREEQDAEHDAGDDREDPEHEGGVAQALTPAVGTHEARGLQLGGLGRVSDQEHFHLLLRG